MPVTGYVDVPKYSRVEKEKQVSLKRQAVS